MPEEKVYSVSVKNNRYNKPIKIWSTKTSKKTVEINKEDYVDVTESDNTIHIRAMEVNLDRTIKVISQTRNPLKRPSNPHYDISINVPIFDDGSSNEPPVENVTVGDDPPPDEEN